MDFPPGFIEDLVLVRGGAFRMKYQFQNEPPSRRFFFILNANPKFDSKLVVVTATTQIKAREAARREYPEVLVHCARSDYDALDQDSVIDCASAQEWDKSEFIARIRQKEIEVIAEVPEPLMSRLAAAIGKSPTLSPKLKRLVLGADRG